MFSISTVRTLVASKDWCASRQVVSIIKHPLFSRTALAKAFGPSWVITFLQPVFFGCETSTMSPLDSVSSGMMISPLNLGSPSCPLTWLPFTARSPRYASSFWARFWLAMRVNSSGLSNISKSSMVSIVYWYLRIVDKSCPTCSGNKSLMCQQRCQEWNISLDPTNPEFN